MKNRYLIIPDRYQISNYDTTDEISQESNYISERAYKISFYFNFRELLE